MEFIKKWLADIGLDETTAVYAQNMIAVAGIIILCVAAHFLARIIFLKVFTYSIRNNRIQWDNYLLERKVLHRLVHIIPAIIIYYSASLFPAYQQWIVKGVYIYLIIVSLLVLSSFLNALQDIYSTFEISKAKPIRGYVQVVKIFVFIIGAVLLISNLIGESPVILLSGIGALSAVLMLIFKDSILGLVAGVQLSTNDMVRVGDWIEMPKYGADGDVIDISLNTVKVSNWDKTITTIPTYALISDSFKNWRGMRNAGGRRIKRSVFVDMSSIAICTAEMIEKYKKIHHIKDYICKKEAEIAQYNEENQIDHSVMVNGRALTNIGTFRAYILSYLENHPGIHKGLIYMVRQLQPVETGLPLEIYAFTNDINWIAYEGVQSDIFDHILAIAPEFGLRVFQNPTGYDMRSAFQAGMEKDSM